MKSTFRRDKPANGSSLKVVWPGRESLSFQQSPASYSAFVSSLYTAYQVDADKLKLVYKDEDGDQASMFDEESYHHAVKHCKGPRLLVTLELYPEHWLKDGNSKRPVPINFKKVMEFYRRNQARIPPLVAVLYRKIIKNKAADVLEIALDNQATSLEDAQKLSVALPCFNCLHLLSIRNGAIGPEGAAALAKGLELLFEYKTALSEGVTAVPHLLTLNLSGNALGVLGITELVRAFGVMDELTTMKLDGNALKAEGGKILAAHLPQLRRLENLGLDDNSLTDPGLSSIADSLPTLIFLKVLWLEGNKLTVNGAHALAGKIPHGLQFLWMSRNDVNVLGQRMLAQATVGRCTVFFS